MKIALILVGVCVLALLVDAVQADNDWPYDNRLEDGDDGRNFFYNLCKP